MTYCLYLYEDYIDVSVCVYSLYMYIFIHDYLCFINSEVLLSNAYLGVVGNKIFWNFYS